MLLGKARSTGSASGTRKALRWLLQGKQSSLGSSQCALVPRVQAVRIWWRDCMKPAAITRRCWRSPAICKGTDFFQTTSETSRNNRSGSLHRNYFHGGASARRYTSGHCCGLCRTRRGAPEVATGRPVREGEGHNVECGNTEDALR